MKKALKGELKRMIWTETDDGNEIYEEVRFILIRDKHKNIIGVSCFSREITKEYTYLRMIRKQNDQLRQIAWMQSHEVRGPVASILGLVDLFNMDNPDDCENIKIIKHIKAAANKLDNVIRKINTKANTS